MDESSFRSGDGVDVFYRRWLPPGEPTLIVLIAHGMSEHSARYARVAEVLTSDGYAVYALDHRGHGRTAASTGAGKTGAAGMDGVLSDMAQLAGMASGEHPSVPTVLFGHSMGALLAQAYVQRDGDGLAGLVLSGSPGVDGAARELADGLRAAADGGMADEPMPALAAFNEGFEPARTPYDWLSRDEREVDLYVADPLCGDEMPMTFGFLADLLAMAADAMEPAGIAAIPGDLPILLLTGEADPVSAGGANVRILEERLRDAGLDVESNYYPDARHEVLNELNRAEVEADLRDWLSSRSGA